MQLVFFQVKLSILGFIVGGPGITPAKVSLLMTSKYSLVYTRTNIYSVSIHVYTP